MTPCSDRARSGLVHQIASSCVPVWNQNKTCGSGVFVHGEAHVVGPCGAAGTIGMQQHVGINIARDMARVEVVQVDLPRTRLSTHAHWRIEQLLGRGAVVQGRRYDGYNTFAYSMLLRMICRGIFQKNQTPSYVMTLAGHSKVHCIVWVYMREANAVCKKLQLSL